MLPQAPSQGRKCRSVEAFVPLLYSGTLATGYVIDEAKNLRQQRKFM